MCWQQTIWLPYCLIMSRVYSFPLCPHVNTRKLNRYKKIRKCIIHLPRFLILPGGLPWYLMIGFCDQGTPHGKRWKSHSVIHISTFLGNCFFLCIECGFVKLGHPCTSMLLVYYGSIPLFARKKADQGENITFLTLPVHWADNSKIIVCRDCIEISLYYSNDSICSKSLWLR